MKIAIEIKTRIAIEVEAKIAIEVEIDEGAINIALLVS